MDNSKSALIKMFILLFSLGLSCIFAIQKLEFALLPPVLLPLLTWAGEKTVDIFVDSQAYRILPLKKPVIDRILLNTSSLCSVNGERDVRYGFNSAGGTINKLSFNIFNRESSAMLIKEVAFSVKSYEDIESISTLRSKCQGGYIDPVYYSVEEDVLADKKTYIGILCEENKGKIYRSTKEVRIDPNGAEFMHINFKVANPGVYVVYVNIKYIIKGKEDIVESPSNKFAIISKEILDEVGLEMESLGFWSKEKGIVKY